MRVLWSTHGSRGDFEPMVGLAVQLRALGAEARVCAPPDFAKLLAAVGVLLVRFGQPATGALPPSSADLPPHAAKLVAAPLDTLGTAAEESDAPVATRVMQTGVWR